MRPVSLALALVVAVSLVAVSCGADEATVDDQLPGRQLHDVDSAASAMEDLDGTVPESLAEVADDPDSSADIVEPDDAPTDRSDADGADAEPAPTTTTTTIDPQSDVDRVAAELMTFVENERGHQFVVRPPIQLLDGPAFSAAFAALVDRDAERNAEDFANYTDVYRALGIIGPDDDLASIWRLFGDAGVIGYYDNVEQAIVLRGGDLTPFTRLVLVHELTHALDDQIFDIDRDEYDDRDDEIGWAFSALVEGNATVIEAAYWDTLTLPEQEAARAEELALPRSVSLSIFTDSFLELQFSRYEHGELLAERLWGGGQDAVDAAFESPVTTSEQVIDLSQYAASPDSQLPLPPAGGTPFESGLWGQIGWAALFADLDPALVDSASGWGGDSWVAWRDGARACVRAHVAADTPDDLDRYAELLEQWATLGDRQIFYPTADVIRVTACG